MGELSSSTIEVARSAAECYRLLCDAERVPEWVAGVASVQVLARDDAGRIATAEYVSMPSRASLVYRVHYTYDDDAMTVRWVIDDPSRRDFEGLASAAALGPERCLITYAVRSAAGEALPEWAHAAFSDESADRLLATFKRWAESG